MWPTLIPLFGKLLDAVLPDAQAAADAKLKLVELAQQGELAKLQADTALATGQLEINKVEASSNRLFVAGWRPFVGWCCGAGLIWASIGHPLAAWLAAIYGWAAPPAVDTEVLIYVLGCLLGFGSLRTVEKVKGAA